MNETLSKARFFPGNQHVQYDQRRVFCWQRFDADVPHRKRADTSADICQDTKRFVRFRPSPRVYFLWEGASLGLFSQKSGSRSLFGEGQRKTTLKYPTSERRSSKQHGSNRVASGGQSGVGDWRIWVVNKHVYQTGYYSHWYYMITFVLWYYMKNVLGACTLWFFFIWDNYVSFYMGYLHLQTSVRLQVFKLVFKFSSAAVRLPHNQQIRNAHFSAHLRLQIINTLIKSRQWFARVIYFPEPAIHVNAVISFYIDVWIRSYKYWSSTSPTLTFRLIFLVAVSW